MFRNPDDVTRALEIVDENEELVAPEAADQYIMDARDTGLAGLRAPCRRRLIRRNGSVASLVTQLCR